MPFTQIEIESHFDGKLQLIYLNQPETYNSLNAEMLKELRKFISECNKDEQGHSHPGPFQGPHL